MSFCPFFTGDRPGAELNGMPLTLTGGLWDLISNSSWGGHGGLGPSSFTYLLCGCDDFTTPSDPRPQFLHL